MLSPNQKYEIDRLFSYHAPTDEQAPRYKAVSDAAKAFAMAVLENTPQGQDQIDAIHLIREARMMANSAIALEEIRRG